MSTVEGVSVGRRIGCFPKGLKVMISEEFERYINTLPDVLSIRGAASFFRVHPITILRLIHKWELKAKKDVNGQWAIKRADLANYCSSYSNL
jgi:hypothetical protein